MRLYPYLLCPQQIFMSFYLYVSRKPKILKNDPLFGKILPTFGHFCGTFGAARNLSPKVPYKCPKTPFLGISISDPLYIYGNRSVTQSRSPPQIDPWSWTINYVVSISVSSSTDFKIDVPFLDRFQFFRSLSMVFLISQIMTIISEFQVSRDNNLPKIMNRSLLLDSIFKYGKQICWSEIE